MNLNSDSPKYIPTGAGGGSADRSGREPLMALPNAREAPQICAGIGLLGGARAVSRVDRPRLELAARRLGDAALDPSVWPDIMKEICQGIGARGAALLQSDVRTADMPRTEGIDELAQKYFGGNWHIHDLRARGVPALLRGEAVVTDQDFVDPEEIHRDPFYQEFLTPLGFRWFAGVGFWAGSALWVLAIQRTVGEGAFTAQEKSALEPLSCLLTEAATLSTAVGRRMVAGMANALDLVRQPAVAVDRMGDVVEANAGAHALFGEDLQLRQRRLVVRDRRAAAALADFFDRMRTVPDTASLDAAPIVVRREEGRPLVIRVLPVAGAARSPFLGARALLVLTDLGAKPEPDPGLVARAFDLIRAEARLASLVATGIGPEVAARKLGLSRETVRAQLKAVFAKTRTHRQSELAALLLRLASLLFAALSLELGII